MIVGSNIASMPHCLYGPAKLSEKLDITTESYISGVSRPTPNTSSVADVCEIGLSMEPRKNTIGRLTQFHWCFAANGLLALTDVHGVISRLVVFRIYLRRWIECVYALEPRAG